MLRRDIDIEARIDEHAAAEAEHMAHCLASDGDIDDTLVHERASEATNYEVFHGISTMREWALVAEHYGVFEADDERTIGEWKGNVFLEAERDLYEQIVENLEREHDVDVV